MLPRAHPRHQEVCPPVRVLQARRVVQSAARGHGVWQPRPPPELNDRALLGRRNPRPRLPAVGAPDREEGEEGARACQGRGRKTKGDGEDWRVREL